MEKALMRGLFLGLALTVPEKEAIGQDEIPLGPWRFSGARYAPAEYSLGKGRLGFTLIPAQTEIGNRSFTLNLEHAPRRFSRKDGFASVNYRLTFGDTSISLWDLFRRDGGYPLHFSAREGRLMVMFRYTF